MKNIVVKILKGIWSLLKLMWGLLKLIWNVLFRLSLSVLILCIIYLTLVASKNTLDITVITYVNDFISDLTLAQRNLFIYLRNISTFFVTVTYAFRLLRLIVINSIKLRRYVAALVDFSILTSGFIVYLFFLPKDQLMNIILYPSKILYSSGFIISYITIYCMCTIYYIYFEQSKYQATLGKMLLNIKVVDEKRNRLSIKVSTIRYLFYFIGVCLFQLLGMIFSQLFFLKSQFLLWFWIGIWIMPIFFTKGNTTLYDILSKTRVIQVVGKKTC